MTKMIISNDNNNYNIILLCKFGNITDYMHIFFFIYEIIIGITPWSCQQNAMYAYTVIASYFIYFHILTYFYELIMLK